MVGGVRWDGRRGGPQGRNQASKNGGLCDKEPTNTSSPLETQCDQVVNETTTITKLSRVIV